MKKLKQLIILITLIILFDTLHYLFKINSTIIPSFYEIINSFLKNFKELFLNSTITFLEATIGLILAIFISYIVGLFILKNAYFKKIVLNLIAIFQMIPIIAIAPLIIIWFGIGYLPKILLILIYSIFPITSNMVKSFDNISKSHSLYIHSLTDDIKKLYTYLYIPLSMDQIFAGIKIAATYSIVCAITVEFIGAKKGLGLMLNKAFSSYSTDLVFLIIITIILLTYLIINIIKIIEQKIRS